MKSRHHRCDQPKILVIGLDGATWDIINPMIQQGKLPNLRNLIETGSHCELESAEPMMSPVIWTSIATGKKPDKHGIRNFYDTQEKIKCSRIWEIFARSGKSVGMFEWLLTSPPKPLKDFIIPGWLATSSATYPQHLEFIKLLIDSGKVCRNQMGRQLASLLKGLGTAIRLATAKELFLTSLYVAFGSGGFYDTHYRKVLAKLRIAGDCASYLLTSYRPFFCGFVFYSIDQISHHYWRFREPAKFPRSSYRDSVKHRGVIEKTYVEVDKVLGRILRCVSEETNIVVISDHGMEAVTDVHYVFKSDEVAVLLEIAEIDRLQIQVVKNNMHIGVNLPESKAKQDLKNQLMASLNKIRLVENDDTLFQVSQDECGNVLAISRFQDLHLSDPMIQFPSGHCVRANSIIETSFLLSGKHAKNGILILRGKHIRRNNRLQPHSIFDVTPTMLALANFPAAKDMDGNIIEEAFEKDFWLKAKTDFIDSYEDDSGSRDQDELPVNEVLTAEDMDIIKDRLKSLGYLE